MARRKTNSLPPEWQHEDELIKRELDRAFKAQSNIGWGHFFRGRIAKAWSIPILTYYRERIPG
jgi:hypothetical protein